MYNEKYFASQLKKAMAFYHIKLQSQLSEITGYSRQLISLWMIGKRVPSIRQIIKISDKLKLDINFFFEEVDPGSHIIEPLEPEVRYIIDRGCRVEPDLKNVIIYSRDFRKIGKYKKVFDKYKITSFRATSVYTLESILKTCRPDCIYVDSELSVRIENVKIIKI